jgi:hypothetical protein
MRTGGRYFQERTYKIRPGPGRKISTDLFLNGKLVKTLRSKNRKLAEEKGETHLRNYYNF